MIRRLPLSDVVEKVACSLDLFLYWVGDILVVFGRSASFHLRHGFGGLFVGIVPTFPKFEPCLDEGHDFLFSCPFVERRTCR